MYQPKSREEYVAKCRYYKGEPMDEEALGENYLLACYEKYWVEKHYTADGLHDLKCLIKDYKEFYTVTLPNAYPEWSQRWEKEIAYWQSEIDKLSETEKANLPNNYAISLATFSLPDACTFSLIDLSQVEAVAKAVDELADFILTNAESLYSYEINIGTESNPNNIDCEGEQVIPRTGGKNIGFEAQAKWDFYLDDEQLLPIENGTKEAMCVKMWRKGDFDRLIKHVHDKGYDKFITIEEC